MGKTKVPYKVVRDAYLGDSNIYVIHNTITANLKYRSRIVLESNTGPDIRFDGRYVKMIGLPEMAVSNRVKAKLLHMKLIRDLNREADLRVSERIVKQLLKETK